MSNIDLSGMNLDGLDNQTIATIRQDLEEVEQYLYRDYLGQLFTRWHLGLLTEPTPTLSFPEWREKYYAGEDTL